MAELIYASDIGAAAFCERLVFLRRVKKIKPDYTGVNIRRQLLHHISMSTEKILVECIFEGVDDTLFLNELFKHRDIQDYLGDALYALGKTKKELNYMLVENSFEEVFELITPYALNKKFRDDEIGLCGVVDKIFWDEFPYPIMIRCGGIPYLSWPNDKLQLTAYALLLEKKYNQKVKYGFIEYPGLQRKPVAFNETLRDDVLKLKNRCIDIFSKDELQICPHGNPKKCGSCRYEQICYTI